MPHSLQLDSTGHVVAYDRSRPQPILPPWFEVTAEQFAAAQALAYPKWTGAGVVDDPPPPPTIEALRAAALTRYQAEAAEVIRANVPTPWDILRDVATVEFAEWADGYLAAVAAELARIEAAVSGAGTAAVLNAIVADWPEVQS